MEADDDNAGTFDEPNPEPLAIPELWREDPDDLVWLSVGCLASVEVGCLEFEELLEDVPLVPLELVFGALCGVPGDDDSSSLDRLM